MKTTIEKVKDLFQNRSKYYESDRKGIDLARNVLSGNGWTEADKKYFGEFKQNISIPLIDSWMNEVKATYSNDPFAIGLKCDIKDISNEKQIFDQILLNNNIEDLAAETLEEILGPGLDYILVTSETTDPVNNLQTIKLRRIDARKVITDYCEDRTMADCQNALIVDILSHKEVADTYELDERFVRRLAQGKDMFADLSLEYDSGCQIPVGTMYEMDGNVCRISKIISEEVLRESVIPFTRIPLIRFTGLAVQLEGIKHYRGVYNRIADLWKIINYSLSEVQYRIATAPSEDYIGDPRGFLPFQDYFNRDNGAKIKPYQRFDADGNDLGELKEINRTPQIAAYMDAVNNLKIITADSLGSTNANPLANETAESVLTRKNTKQATINEFMHHLQVGLKAVGEVILDLMLTVYDKPRQIPNSGAPEQWPIQPAITDILDIDIEVTDGPVKASLRLNQMQQAVAMLNMAVASQTPGASQKFMPLIVELSELDEDFKQRILKQMAGELSPEVQQQLMAKDQQIQQLTMTVQESEKVIAALQIQVNELMNDSKTKYAIEELKANTQIKIEYMKLNNSNQQLTAKIVADAEKQQKDIEADLVKDITKTVTAPATPVFDKGRFI